MPQIQNYFLCMFLSAFCCEILKFCYNVFNDYISLKRKKSVCKKRFYRDIEMPKVIFNDKYF